MMPDIDLDFSAQAYTISTWIIPILLAITLHEAAHGIIAWSYGDDTAYKLGRVTLNPLKHVDPMGTVTLVNPCSTATVCGAGGSGCA